MRNWQVVYWHDHSHTASHYVTAEDAESALEATRAAYPGRVHDPVTYDLGPAPADAGVASGTQQDPGDPWCCPWCGEASEATVGVPEDRRSLVAWDRWLEEHVTECDDWKRENGEML